MTLIAMTCPNCKGSAHRGMVRGQWVCGCGWSAFGEDVPPKASPSEAARIERTSAEHHERLAMLLWQGADAFGRVVAAVERMDNEGYQAAIDELPNTDLIVCNGPGIIRALRSLAMRLDRAVMVKATKGD